MEEQNNAVEKVENIADKNKKKAEKKRQKEIKKDEKERRALAYRRERSRILAEREQAREEIKKKKAIEKEKRKNIKLQNKQKNRENRKGLGGWITAVVSLGVFTALLTTALVFTLIVPNEDDNAINGIYAKSYYDTTTQIDNMDANLSKAILSYDSGAMQKYLVDIAINSELAQNDINQLPLQDENKFYTTKLINQVGDYSKFLNNKIIDGEPVTQEERSTLTRLHGAVITLKNTFQTMSAGMDNKYSFSSMGKGDETDIVIKELNQLQNLSVEYPELIYDGPFSDGKENREVKGLDKTEITSSDAKSIFTQTFGEYGLTDVDVIGESAGVIPSFNVQAMVKDDILYAQVSKNGGKVIMFSYSGSCKDTNFNREEANNKGQAFLDALGLTNMESVWINLANNVYTINYAYKQEKVIVYSDLIKVRICAETGMVIGMEASSYYTNHTIRNIASPAIASTTAGTKVSTDIAIESSRLCVIPIGNASEKLCYEFSGRFNNNLYFVYIDAKTGKQIEMFKVIDSTNGELLI